MVTDEESGWVLGGWEGRVAGKGASKLGDDGGVEFPQTVGGEGGSHNGDWRRAGQSSPHRIIEDTGVASKSRLSLFYFVF